MSAKLFPRSITARRLKLCSFSLFRTNPRISYVPLRYASTVRIKHPPNFTPPSKEDLHELREKVREFTKREIPPSYASQIDQSNNFPPEMWTKLGNASFLGITAEQDYGGLELGYQSHCIVMEELSRSSASIALSYAAHSQLCINQFTLHGTPEQKSRLLPDLISGQKIGALAMSEVASGSDVVSMKTVATKTPDNSGWLLNGTKMWITNGPEADVIIVYAKTDPPAGSKGITTFLVEPKNTTGFSVSRKIDKLGMRGSNTGELIFQDCFVPAENQLGELNKGVKVLMSGLDLERLVLAAGPVGIMQACLDHTLPYIHERKQFDTPIAHFQLIQDKVAKMYTDYQASKAYLYGTAARVDEEGLVSSRDCAGVILYAAEKATQCALEAIQCLGGNGYTNDYPVGRLWRDAKLYEIGAGTTEVRKIVIGRSFTREWEESGGFQF